MEIVTKIITKLQESTVFTKAKSNSYKGFTLDDTGTWIYNDFLTKEGLKAKEEDDGVIAYIAEMTPTEYLRQSAKLHSTTVSSEATFMDNAKCEKYAKMMKTGTKFHLPVLDYAYNQQEGRHRAKAALMVGIDKIPVLIVTDL